MAETSLALWPWGHRHRRRSLAPFDELQLEINQVFDDMWGGFRAAPLARNVRFAEVLPSMGVAETDTAVTVSAELPGLNIQEIEITLSEGHLTLKGEKKIERDEQTATYHLTERAFGTFRRSIPLPPEAEPDKAEAIFENGILTITIPKMESAKATTKTVEIKVKH